MKGGGGPSFLRPHEQFCRSGIRCLCDPGSGSFLTPGSGMGEKSGFGSGRNKPDHISERLLLFHSNYSYSAVITPIPQLDGQCTISDSSFNSLPTILQQLQPTALHLPTRQQVCLQLLRQPIHPARFQIWLPSSRCSLQLLWILPVLVKNYASSVKCGITTSATPGATSATWNMRTPNYFKFALPVPSLVIIL